MAWIIVGSLLVTAGIALLLDLKGAANVLWRFWASRWSEVGRRPVANPLFVRLWFGALCVAIGAAWIYVGS